MNRMIALLIIAGLFATMCGVAVAQSATESCSFDNGHHSMALDLSTQAMDDVEENNPHVTCEDNDGPIGGDL